MLTRLTLWIRPVSAIIAIFFLILAGLSACTSNANPTNNQSPITIGVSLSLTGDFSTDGKATKQGYELWADLTNKNGGLLGRQVRLDILNDASKTEQTITNYEKLIAQDHVNFVVGPFADDFTVAGARVAQRHHYLFLEGIGTAPSTFQQNLDNLFAVSLPATRYLSTFVDYVLSLPKDVRPKTVAYVTSDDPFTQPQIDNAKPQFEAGGLKTLLYTVYPAETTDYKPIAQKIIASGADVVVLGTLGEPDCVAYLQAFKQQHFNPKLIVATAGPDQGDAFVKALGGPQIAEGMIVPNDGWWPSKGQDAFQQQQFVSGYLAKYGGSQNDISSDTVQAFSVMQVLAQAVNKIHSLDNVALMQVLRTNTFSTLQGPVKFGPDGQNIAAIPFLFQWQKGQLIPVFPLSQAQQNPEFPKPAWPTS